MTVLVCAVLMSVSKHQSALKEGFPSVTYSKECNWKYTTTTISKWVYQINIECNAWPFMLFKPLNVIFSESSPLFKEHRRVFPLLHILGLSVSQKSHLSPAATWQTDFGSCCGYLSCICLWPGVKILVLSYKWTRPEIFVSFPPSQYTVKHTA